MSKPWEQEWKTGEVSGLAVYTDNGGLVVHAYTDDQPMKDALGAATLCAAAPDMARALLAIRERVAEAGQGLPTMKDADAVAAMDDCQVPIPTALLRAALDALRKAGAL